MPIDREALLDVIAGWRAEHRKAFAELKNLDDFPRKRMTDAQRIEAGLDTVVDGEPGGLSNPERIVINGPAVARWIEERLNEADLSSWPLTDSGDHIKTGAKILRQYAHYGELQPLIRAKEMEKYLSTYGGPLLEKLDEDGRLRSSLTLCAAKTGRSASSKPNAQNFPRQGFKHIFRPLPGRVFVKADLGSIELRVVACIAEDPEMLNAFQDPELDLHTLTASEALGAPYDEVTKTQRNTGKATNFLSLYGGGGAALRARLIEDRALLGEVLDDVPSEDECQAFIDAFWNRWSGVAEWRKHLIADLREATSEGFAAVVRTPLGRLVPVPPNKGQLERADAAGRPRPLFNFTLACNAPVQGGAAECAMAILARLHKQLWNVPNASIVAFVHDEFVIECDACDAEQVKDVLTTAMIDGCLAVFPSMPTEGLVEAEIVERWAEPSEDNRRLPTPTARLRGMAKEVR
jgi:DNA polymerase-1